MSEDRNQEFNGIPLEQWDQAFHIGMAEYAATCFVFSSENKDLIRVAFGNKGPFIDSEGRRSPRYTHAVTLSPDVALELAQLIIAHYSKPNAS